MYAPPRASPLDFRGMLCELCTMRETKQHPHLRQKEKKKDVVILEKRNKRKCSAARGRSVQHSKQGKVWPYNQVTSSVSLLLCLVASGMHAGPVFNTASSGARSLACLLARLARSARSPAPFVKKSRRVR